MKRETLPVRLDESARWIGIPIVAEAFYGGKDSQRRHLRWLPILALLLAACGTVAFFTLGRPQITGPLLFLTGFLISIWLPLFGPVKPWGSAKLDEYDREVRRSAFLFAYAFSTGFSLLAFVLIGAAMREGVEDRMIGNALGLAAGWLLIFQGTLPTLWASWRTKPVETE